MLERLIELKANLEQGRKLCELVHSREQLKLKKLMYIYEIVVEAHYLRMGHAGRRPLTYNVGQGVRCHLAEGHVRVRGQNQLHPLRHRLR